jgi:hypothetical protein
MFRHMLLDLFEALSPSIYTAGSALLHQRLCTLNRFAAPELPLLHICHYQNRLFTLIYSFTRLHAYIFDCLLVNLSWTTKVTMSLEEVQPCLTV